MPNPKDLPRDVGGFIRDLRRNAKISLRQLAEQAGVSNPYLSQIERGLRKPSAEVLQQLASALRVSTPVMYLRAGLLDDKDGQGVLAAVATDDHLTMAQKQTLSQIYETFRRENIRLAEATGAQAREATGAEVAEAEAAGAEFAEAEVAEAAEAAAPHAPAPSPAPPAPAPSIPEAAEIAAEAVLESVAVTETSAAPAPRAANETRTRTVKKTARKAVKRTAATAEPTAPAVEEEKP